MRLRVASIAGRLRRGERGTSVIELSLAAMISLATLGLVGGAMTAALRTGTFASNQSTSLDGARQVLIQLARDLQGSTTFSLPETVPGVKGSCQAGDPPGSCALVMVTTPPGPSRLVRLRLDGVNLYRETYDPDASTWASQLLSDRIANRSASPAEPMFVCTATTSGSLLQVKVHMLVQPDPANAPRYQLDTIVRPRNTYQPAGC